MKFVQYEPPRVCMTFWRWLFWWKDTGGHIILRVFGFKFAKKKV